MIAVSISVTRQGRITKLDINWIMGHGNMLSMSDKTRRRFLSVSTLQADTSLRSYIYHTELKEVVEVVGNPCFWNSDNLAGRCGFIFEYFAMTLSSSDRSTKRKWVYLKSRHMELNYKSY